MYRTAEEHAIGVAIWTGDDSMQVGDDGADSMYQYAVKLADKWAINGLDSV